jgi:hypothetical protein
MTLAHPPSFPFCAVATGPQGGSLYKHGNRRVSAAVRSSEPHLPFVEIHAYFDESHTPCIRLQACVPGEPRTHVFYEGPLSIDVIFGPEPECPECEDEGWAIFNARPEEGYLGEVQACDCGLLGSDETALEVARSAGWSVTDDYQVLREP